jgi:AraC family transcriptional regulator
MPPIPHGDSTSGVIADWKYGALHDVVAPMADHVLMTSPRDRCGSSGGREIGGWNGASCHGDSHRGRLDLAMGPESLNVIHLYLSQTTLERVALEAGTGSPGDLLD